MPINLKRLLFSMLIPLVCGFAASYIAGGSELYGTLEKPPLSPPGWVFPVVWVILYIMMGIAYYLVTDPKVRDNKRAKIFYYIQLALNFSWPIFFFGFNFFPFAALVIVAIIVFLVLTYIEFHRINRTAALILIPYFIWLLYALYINIGVAVLN